MAHDDVDEMVAQLDASTAIAGARKALLVVAVLGAAGLLMTYGRAWQQYGHLIGLDTFLKGLAFDASFVLGYFLCWLWAGKNPRPAIYTAFGLFLLSWGIAIALNPAAWHAGIVLRVIVVTFLLRGVIAMKRLGDLSKPGRVRPDVFD